MGPERYRRAGDLYHAALDLAPEQRTAFLEQACGSDLDLRSEVESLLTAHEQAGQFIEAPHEQANSFLQSMLDSAADASPKSVGRATLHNWSELARKRIRVGDVVEVIRAGDVIPEVVGRVAPPHGGAKPRPPRTCPACRAGVVKRGPVRLCPNTIGCPAQRIRAIQHFASRDAFDIDGLGPTTVQLLVDQGLVRSVADPLGSRHGFARSPRFAVPARHNWPPPPAWGIRSLVRSSISSSVRPVSR